MCKLCDKVGQSKCPTHSPKVNLKERNSKVAKAFKINNPNGFTAQRSHAGHNGFLATGANKGWEKANEKARQWRMEHPSQPEREVIKILQSLSYWFEREALIFDNCPVDFLLKNNLVIEVNGHQFKPSFGEVDSREEKQVKKIRRLQEAGYQVLVLDSRKQANWPDSIQNFVNSNKQEALEF